MEERDLFDNVKSDAVYAPEMVEKQLMFWGGSLAAVFSAPAEMILRWRFGSTHFSPVTVFAAVVTMWIATVIGLFFERAWQFASGGPRPVGMLEVTLAVHVLIAIHGYRVFRLMSNPASEEDSREEGPPLPFFRFFPRASWTMIRVIYEPVTILAATLVLYVLGITAMSVFLYGIFVAHMLALRNIIQWYDLFLTIRTALDGRHRTKVLMEVVKGVTKPENVNPGILARASGVPAEDRLRIARIVTGAR